MNWNALPLIILIFGVVAWISYFIIKSAKKDARKKMNEEEEEEEAIDNLGM
jgi:hypothetical protein